MILLTCAFIGLSLTYCINSNRPINTQGRPTEISIPFFMFYYLIINILLNIAAIIDWKNFQVESLPGHLEMDYFYWSNRSSCRLVQYFGGVLSRRPANASIAVGDFASGDISPVVGYDGHYAVCLDPIHVAPRPDDRCIVYSFGIKNEWSFDDAMEKYGCTVYAFDPAMNNSIQRGQRIHFRNLALNDVDQGEQNRTLSTIYEAFGHRKDDVVIDYIKIDIEGDEWRIIPKMMDLVIDRVKQLAIEIHLETDRDLAYYRRMVGIVKSIEDLGMVRFDSYYNHWSSAHFPALNQSSPFAYIMAWYNPKFL